MIWILENIISFLSESELRRLIWILCLYVNYGAGIGTHFGGVWVQFTHLLAEHLALCVSPQPSSHDPSAPVALSAARAAFDPVRAGAQAVPAGPCGPKKTQENPIEVCPDNQKASLVIVWLCLLWIVKTYSNIQLLLSSHMYSMINILLQQPDQHVVESALFTWASFNLLMR